MKNNCDIFILVLILWAIEWTCFLQGTHRLTRIEGLTNKIKFDNILVKHLHSFLSNCEQRIK